ncbi:hypothetical protein ACFZA2_11340 [Microbacterium sp. NPDC007973]|uniref:hypothetical protein n=1 Tax=Microbacterium sp. NPDC007973 TaxID=3364182 RepID=UPI0036E9B8BA
MTRTDLSAPEMLWLPPSPHESAPGSAAGLDGCGVTVTTGAEVASASGAGESVTTEGDGTGAVGTDAVGEASEAP